MNMKAHAPQADTSKETPPANQTMVEAIRNETASVVKVMRESVDAAKDSRELVEASRTSLEEINELRRRIRFRCSRPSCPWQKRCWTACRFMSCQG